MARGSESPSRHDSRSGTAWWAGRCAPLATCSTRLNACLAERPPIQVGGERRGPGPRIPRRRTSTAAPSSCSGRTATFGLIATNTIAQGDTRATGLRGSAARRHDLRGAQASEVAGAAAVIVSVVHVARARPRRRSVSMATGRPDHGIPVPCRWRRRPGAARCERGQELHGSTSGHGVHVRRHGQERCREPDVSDAAS